jgi:hypothetical protein
MSDNSIVQINNPNVEVSPYGIKFLASVSEEEWLKIFDAVQAVQGVIQFYLGDLAVYAESPVTGWGHSKYDELVAKTGYDQESIEQMAMVSRRFPVEFRKTGGTGTTHLPWSFYKALAVVSSDSDVQNLINQCIEGKWTRVRLREEVQKVLHPKIQTTATEIENPVFSWPKHEAVAAMDEGTEVIRDTITLMQQSKEDPITKNYLLLQEAKKLLNAVVSILIKLTDVDKEAVELVRKALELL